MIYIKYFIHTEDSDKEWYWHSVDSDEYLTDENYLYKEEWVAGPDTRLEDLPQACPYGSDAMLIPGFVRKVYRRRKD